MAEGGEMSAKIHPLAVVDPAAELGDGVEVGPFCTVGPHVRLGDGCVLRSHVSVSGHTTLGAGCEVWPFASVGGKTQDLKYKGGAPRLTVGEGTVIRECATLSCATFDGMETKMGAFFSCLTWRAIPGPLSKLHRRIDSL